MNLRTLVDRAADPGDRPVHLHPHHRRHRVHHAAGVRVPGSGAADDRGPGQLPGASAQTVADTVATPIEQEVNGVEDMLYMYSQSTGDGRMTLTVTFKLGTDLDEAQVLVQNRVAIAEARLPEEVRRGGVQTRKSSPDLMMVVFLLSPDETYDQLYISNYALRRVRDELLRLDGVGDIQIFGARDYSMRIWLDPDKIAAVGMTAGRGRRRDPRAERPDRRRADRRAADLQPGLPAQPHVPRTPGRCRCVRQHHRQVVPGRPDRPVARRGARRARRPAILDQQLSAAQAGGGAGGVPAARLQRAGDRGAGRGGDGEARAAVPEGIDLQQRLQPDRVHRRVGQ